MDAGHVQARGGPFVAGEGTIRLLAEAAVLGVPVDRLLRTSDETERLLLQAVVKEAWEVLRTVHTELARKIVNEYAEARKRGEKKKS